MNVLIYNAAALLLLSATTILQPLYIPDDNELKLRVVFPDEILSEVKLQVDPLSVTVPASSEWKVKDGVVLSVGLVTGVIIERIGAAISAVLNPFSMS